MKMEKKIEKIVSSMNLGSEVDVEECWTGGIQKQKVMVFSEGFVVIEPFFHDFQWTRKIRGHRYDSITSFTARFRSVEPTYGYFSHKLEWHGSFTQPLKDYFFTSEKFESPSKKLLRKLSKLIADKHWDTIKLDLMEGREIIFGYSFDGDYKISKFSIGKYSLDRTKEVRLTVDSVDDSDSCLLLQIFIHPEDYKNQLRSEIENIQGRYLTESELLKLGKQEDYPVMVWHVERIHNPQLLFKCLDFLNLPIATDKETKDLVEILK
ncbi:hypothetical protein [Leptolyngbya sp. PCC 6406]|uniref:hypothetical protein n=1 Tax=Leptolyngbya sp. PCC 6406 TaxID=1173264 RepID=UPI0012DCD645|nr:hypothetical protein [Leptolyngbya sp. PCC 6406]